MTSHLEGLQGDQHQASIESINLHEMVICLALAVITTVGNLLVVVTVYKDPYNELRTVSNYLVVNLALADLIVGLISEPLWALQYWVKEKHYSIAVNVSLTLAVEASCLTVLSLTIERYVVLEKPVIVQSRFNKPVLKMCIFIIWLTAALISSLQLVYHVKAHSDKRNAYYLFLFDGVGLLLFPVIMCLNIRILFVIRKFNRSVFGLPDQSSLETPLLQCRQELLKMRRKEQKIAKVIFLFVGVFVLCWLPSLITETFRYFSSKGSSRRITTDVQRLVIFLGLLNSALNPVIYSIRIQTFRRAIRHLFLPANGTQTVL